MGAFSECFHDTIERESNFDVTDLVRDMNCRDIDRMRAALTADARRLIVTHPRERSLAASIAAAHRPRSDRRCRVTNVFDTGDGFGLMCKIERGDSVDPGIFVAPLAALAFDRRRPITREIVDYRRRRAQRRIGDMA
jgi:hypothetical protein